jgi:NAD(P)-dependent dehydrogenase (short-subunit alcohol dehydrogenase family)
MKISDKSFYRSVPEPHYFAMKRVLVTGATGSIGKACCMWLLNQGARVAMVGKDLQDLVRVGSQFPSQVVCIQSDLTKDNEHQDIVDSAVENLGGLDVLINAAGVFYENDLENSSPREHDYIMNINLRATFSLSSICSFHLKKSSGCIVNISSAWAARPQQGMISYCMSKAGVDMLTKSLSVELAPIRVNAVAPGLLATKFLNKTFNPEDIKVIRNNFKNKNPLHRIGRVDDVVKSIVFLCSKKASKITGEILKVDGGLSITSSLFIDWDSIYKMNSKLAPDSLKVSSKFFNLIKHFEKFKSYNKKDGWIKNTIADSNWDTNLSDAHYKITENYNKIDGEDNILGALAQRKDVGGEIYTDQNPKNARFIDSKK